MKKVILFFLLFASYATAQVNIRGASIAIGGTTASAGVVSINGVAGVYTFNGSGVSCSSTTCTFTGAAAGLTSLNGLTGPALNLTSSDSSVIFTPSGTSIDLKATPSAGDVKYFTGNFIVFGDSRLNISTSYQTVDPTYPSYNNEGPITSGTVTGGVATFNATNYTAAGNTIMLYGFTGAYTPLNNQIVTLSGETSTTLTATVTGVPDGSTGAGNFVGAYNLIGNMMRSPSMSKVNAIVPLVTGNLTTTQGVTQATTLLTPYAPATTGVPATVFVQAGIGDFLFSGHDCTGATTETNLAKIFSIAHGLGMKVIASTIIPDVGSVAACSTNVATMAFYTYPVSLYVRTALAKSLSTINGTACPASYTNCYWDDLIDSVALFPDVTDTNLFQTSGHLTDRGTYVWTKQLEKTAGLQISDNLVNPNFGNNIATLSGVNNYFTGSVYLNGSTYWNNVKSSQAVCFAQGLGALGNLTNSGCTAAGLYAASTLPNGTTATTQSALNNSTKVATTAYVDSAVAAGGGGLSGMTIGQVPIAASASTVTSSKALAGTGVAIATGPATSTANDIVSYADTAGRQQDSGVSVTSVVNAVSPSAPIVASITGNILNVSCPTCGTSTGGTNVSQNSGSAEANLPLTGFMPQVCADTSLSGTAQSCTVANTFVPQAGNCVVYTTTTANSGTGLTVNVNSLGVKSVAIPGASGFTTTLTASIIPANKPQLMCYDGTNWNDQQTGTVSAGSSSGALTNITGSSQITATGCTQSGSTGGTCSVVGTSTTTVTLSAIPGTYTHLLVMFRGLTTGGGTSFLMRVNGDSGANYSSQGTYSQNTTAGQSINSVSATTANIGQMGGLGELVSSTSVDFPYYVSTSFPKSIMSKSSRFASVSSGTNNQSSIVNSLWNNTAAITSMSFTILGGLNYANGSTFTIYGVN